MIARRTKKTPEESIEPGSISPATDLGQSQALVSPIVQERLQQVFAEDPELIRQVGSAYLDQVNAATRLRHAEAARGEADAAYRSQQAEEFRIKNRQRELELPRWVEAGKAASIIGWMLVAGAAAIFAHEVYHYVLSENRLGLWLVMQIAALGIAFIATPSIVSRIVGWIRR